MDNLNAFYVPTFDALEREHRSFVLGFIHKKIGDRETAEDLTQKVLVKAYLALPRYRPDGPIRAWLIQIAKNHLMTYWKKKKIATVPIVICKGGEWRWLEVPSGAPPVLQGIEDRERSERIAMALSRLPAQLQELILLRYEQDMSYDRISDIMGISEATARTWAFRARNRLREILNEVN